MSEYLTTKELAELLRIKERKVYDLAASGAVPCSKAMGKLLFPRDAVTAWLSEKSSGVGVGPGLKRPNVFLGSHDPLLDWALRESRCGLASYFDGSLDGLDRFAKGEGVATGLHLFDPKTEEWNLDAVRDRFGAQPVVLVEWTWRERGLIVPKGLELQMSGLTDLKGRRIVPRQAEAGSQKLLEHLLGESGIRETDLSLLPEVRTEADAALAVLEGKADAAFGLRALAGQYRLGFVPLARERYDLLVERRAWFEPAFRTFLSFCRSEAFAAKAAETEGYEASGLGKVHFNGA